jgi:hypothetical protein
MISASLAIPAVFGVLPTLRIDAAVSLSLTQLRQAGLEPPHALQGAFVQRPSWIRVVAVPTLSQGDLHKVLDTGFQDGPLL